MNNNNKLLISSSAKKTIRESVLLAKELNTGIEISRLPIYKTKGLTVEDAIKILKSDLIGFDNRVTVHAMFSDINIAGQDYMLREIAELRNQQSFEVGKSLGADTILYHTGNKGTKHYGSIEIFKKNFIAFLLLSILLPKISASERINSRLIVSISLCGSIEPSTCIMSSLSKQRTT